LKIYKLFEVPYIDFDSGSKTFDLQMEELKTGKQVIDFIINIFHGKSVTDKYGNTITLKNHNEKLEFFNNMYKDQIFNALINKLLTENEKQLLSILIKKEL
jgi:hypothetical protein